MKFDFRSLSFSRLCRKLLVFEITFLYIFLLSITDITSNKLRKESDCLNQRFECEKGNGSRTVLAKVCGTDNITYVNECVLKMEKCKGFPVDVKHRGRCRSKQPCLKILKNIQRVKKPSHMLFVPTCLEDGRYAPVQCHKQTGYCWCVTPKGRPVPNTSRRKQKPNCTRRAKTRRRASTRKSHREFCDRSDKQRFNVNLMNFFRAEYGHADEADDADLDRKILNWKFQSIDRNEDDFLQKPEYRSLRRLKKLVKPKKCAKTFAKICDMDRDMRISREEWSACLGVDFTSLKESAVATLSGQLTGLKQDGRRKEDTEANDCLSDRQAVLAEQRANDLYVPECTQDGRYRKMQCYKSTGYCWCVHEDDGKPIPGTSVKDELPKCDAIPTPVRPMKGCPGEKRTLFLKDLMEFLMNKIPAANASSQNLQLDVATRSFLNLDSNNNKYLERKEWKTFRTLVAGDKNLRRCGRRLPKYCDINNDRKISMTEWLNCVDSQKLNPPPSNITMTTVSPTQISKRIGPNPLMIHLKDDDDD